jgi:HrpA-like RNA helicase
MNLTNIIHNINTYNITHIVASTNFFTKIELTNELKKKNLQSFLATTTVEEAKTLADYQNSVFISKYEDINNNISLSKYSSSSSLKNLILNYFQNGTITKHIDFCDVLILDAYDVGLIDYTVIISLWNLAVSLQVKFPKLVIITYVPMNIIDSINTFIYKNSITPKIEYLENDLTENRIDAIFESIKQILHKKILINKINKNIVIFVAGEKEINKLFKLLKNERIQSLEIIKIYNAKQSSENVIQSSRNVFKLNNFKTNVIITNNTFELLNLYNITYVVDTMYEQIQDLNANKSLRYVNKSVSKDTAIKRCDYIKDIKGVCYRLCSKNFYDNLANNNIFEISRIPIYNTILELINVGLNPKDVLIVKNDPNVNECVDTLVFNKMITLDNKITEKGIFLYDLPLSNLMCQFLWMWFEGKNSLFAGIVIACLIDCYGPTYIYLQKWDEENKNSYKTKNPDFIKGDNDLEILINIWNDLLEKNEGIEINNKTINDWCSLHSIKQDKIIELLTYINKCCDNLSNKTNMELEIIDESVINLKALPIFEILYSDMILTKTSKYNYKNLKNNKEYILDNKNLYETAPNKLLALITFNNKIQLSINLPNDKNQNNKTKNNKIQNRISNDKTNFNTKIDTDKVDNALHLLETISIDNLFEIVDEPKSSLMELIDDLEI